MIHNKTKFFLSFILSFSLFTAAFAQNNVKQTIKWFKNTENTNTDKSELVLNEHFEGEYFLNNNKLPLYNNNLNVKGTGYVRIQVVSFKSEPIDILGRHEEIDNLPTKPEVTAFIEQEKNNFKAHYSLIPLIKQENGQVEKILEFVLSVDITYDSSNSHFRGPEFKEESVLKDGEIFKFAVDKSGIFKISYQDLETFGVSPQNINPKKIQIFGNPGGPNPEPIEADKYDDLVENSIFIPGENDNQFDQEDYILFYAAGPHAWQHEENEGFNYTHNIYDDQNYYFLKIGDQDGKRVTDRNTLSGEIIASNIYDKFIRYEKDEFNLLGDYESAEGSGQLWFSDKYTSERQQDFSASFSDPDLDVSNSVKFKIQFASRSANSSKAILEVDGTENTINFNGVSVSNIESSYADLEFRTFSQMVNTSSPNVQLNYPLTPAQSIGWLDYIQMEYQAKLNYVGQAYEFRNFQSIDESTFGFTIANSSGEPTIWDITDPEKVQNQKYNSGSGNINFNYVSEGLHNFVIFNPDNITNTVAFISEIENQNLHSISDVDMVIIYHENFKDASLKLTDHRSSHDNLSVMAIPIQEIYNEFSSGKVDATAIRNFARMLYVRDPDFNYVLLMGDGSYDYKHIRDNEYSDENFIPVYETQQSLDPIKAFPTDDFYALLDLQEGDNLKGGIDIAVGRLTVRTAEEADAVVNKLIKYDTDPSTFGDWRLRLAFAGDDEDSNLHMRDSDNIAESVRASQRQFNQEKIFFDAYPQVSTPGGERYPLAEEALNQNVFKGLLTLCYLGHGGPKGWAQERVLKLDDIQNWDNEDKMPLVVTATCSFTGFDDAKITSAGESALLKEKGGAIGLFTTVRAVYASSNKRLTQAVYDTIFTKVDGDYMRIGEILRRAKNTNKADTLDINARKFLLVGDPSMKLALPEHNIVTSKINDQLIDENYQPDTIKALQKITFEGYIENENGGIKTDFNGTAFCSVFDKELQAKTLGNNTGSSPRPFNIQKTVLFKGQAEVVNGEFNFEFYLPSDINFEFGKGKISLYANSSDTDAQGQFENFYIGGSEPANSDDEAPLVDVFLNTEDFVFGGISTSDPILLVKLQDDFGINVAGVSVGHDLTAEIDGESQEKFILNDFYESELNDFRRGTVKFPLKDLEPGRHSIKIKAWDLSNNLGEGYTEFIVTDDLGESLRQVFNYPNPFSTRTVFQFEHNLPGTELEIIINIYNMSGQIVKTIEHLSFDGGFRIDDIEWDGNDDFGGKIANGVYLYKINVLAKQLGISKESNFEKLVILK